MHKSIKLYALVFCLYFVSYASLCFTLIQSTDSATQIETINLEIPDTTQQTAVTIEEKEVATSDIPEVVEVTSEQIMMPSEQLYYDILFRNDLQYNVQYYMKYMNININEAYIYALIYKESKFNSTATGSCGDSGYCQILKRYFNHIYNGLMEDYPELVADDNLVKDIYSENTNIACGIYWLNECSIQSTGKPLSDDTLTAALTTYNRGIGGATKYFKKHGTYESDYSKAIYVLAEKIKSGQQLP